ncbi:MAG: tRNA adenosine(34) deaminase TadA [Gammaproteobacteria bacterium]
MKGEGSAFRPEHLTGADDERWMRQALALAGRAEEQGEVPVGAVVVRDDEIVGEGWNQPIGRNDPTAHAEIVALRRAAERIGNYRLTGCSLIVTLEPCVMCAGASVHARIARVLYGARDPKAGAAGSVFQILGSGRFNHYVEVRGGILETECCGLLKRFFERRRADKSLAATVSRCGG